MSDDLMSDKSRPPVSDGAVENILTRNDMRRTVVKVIFVKRSQKLPDQRPRRFEFATVVLANEFIQTIKPPPGAQLGSPKQWRAKIARLLRLSDLSVINNYEIHTELEIDQLAPAGDDTGVMLNDDDTPVDTFVEGSEPPVLDEDILAAVDAGQGNTEEFPE